MMKKYNNYKDSGIEWIGEIPHNWEVILFKRVIDRIKDGTHGSYQRVSAGHPFLSAKNVYDNGIRVSENESYISELDFLEITKNGFPKKNDLLITCVGTIGRTYVYDFVETMAFQRSVTFIRLNNRNNPQFYKYYVQSSIYQNLLTSLAKTSAQSGVYMNDLMNSTTLKLPLEEQTAIANYLDRKTTQIDQLISQKKRFIELLQEERTAVINQAVTKGLDPTVKMKDSGIEWLGEIPEHWDVKKLKFFCFITKLSGFEYTKEWETNEKGEIIALRGYNISNGKINDIKTEKISSELSSKLFRSKLYKNDIVYPCTGTIGNAAIVEENDKYHINQNIARINPNVNLVYPNFLFFNLIADATKKQIDFNNVSSMQPVILIGDLRNIIIAFPPYEEQVKLVIMIEKALKGIEILLANSENEIILLKEYKTALISEVVTGKVDVREEVLV
jgi:type I restriction enzyme S subunit